MSGQADQNRKPHEKPLSLYPLTPEEAIKRILQAPPMHKSAQPKKPKGSPKSKKK